MSHEFNERVNELNIAYDDIITSTKEHLQMNTAIMRKEKEIKELEARIAFLSNSGGDGEYTRLMNIYEEEKRTLADLYGNTRSQDSMRMEWKHKNEYLTQNLRQLR